jgi:hypothetical protein
MYKIDKHLVRAYKSIFINKLKDIEAWGMYGSKNRTLSEGKKYEYDTTIYDESRTSIRFIIKYDNDVKMSISSSDVYTFKIWENLDLLPKILTFKKMKSNEGKDKKIKDYEDLMKQHLPDEYKRSIKISKIKSKL